MAKRKANTQILTEDIFNANGNAHVDSQVLNENAKDDTQDKDDDINKSSSEDKQDEAVQTNDESIAIEKELVDEDIHVTSKIEFKDESVSEDNIEDKKNDTEILKNDIKTDDSLQNDTPIVKKSYPKTKMGFNDESYYL